MKTLAFKMHLTRVALVGALSIVPALALTGSAQADPAWNRNAPNGNNGRTFHQDNQRDDRRAQNRRDHDQSYNNSATYRNQPRYDARDNGRRDDYRIGDRNYGYGNNGYYGNSGYGNYGYGNNGYYGNSGHDYDRDRYNNHSNDTVVAGVIGAIIGSVLSR